MKVNGYTVILNEENLRLHSKAYIVSIAKCHIENAQTVQFGFLFYDPCLTLSPIMKRDYVKERFRSMAEMDSREVVLFSNELLNPRFPEKSFRLGTCWEELSEKAFHAEHGFSLESDVVQKGDINWVYFFSVDPERDFGFIEPTKDLNSLIQQIVDNDVYTYTKKEGRVWYEEIMNQPK